MLNFKPTLDQLLQSALEHHQAGRLHEAEAIYREILQQDPRHADALHLLGVLSAQLQRPSLAVELMRQAIFLKPKDSEIHSNLGNVLREQGAMEEAIAAYRRAIALNPHSPAALSNLGNALKDMGQVDAAIAAHRQAIALNPGLAASHFNLGVALEAGRQLDEAVAAYRQAIALEPDFFHAHHNLGSALKDRGEITEAVDSCRRAVALHPGSSEAHSNLVYSLYFHPGYGAHAIREELACWNQRHAAPLKKFIRPHVNTRDPERRLRIGYVSPDFCDHVVGRNILSLFQHHDQSGFDLFCYADLAKPDALTEEFRRRGTFRVVSRMSDDDLAEQIRADAIDVLVDLALHMTGNRLLVFARRPAPVQFTFAGYPGSTGLELIDYRLTDPYLDPPGSDESLSSERIFRLPDAFWCYEPLDGRHVPVNSLPAAEKGVVTFGCLNNFCKINDELLRLWARVLRQVEGSKLLLLAAEGTHRQRTLARLSEEGIVPARVEFIVHQPHRLYLEQYHRIDIGLDSFPYNGHTTSLDSFWMGVPVVTQAGQTAVARAGWCQLANLGLPELAGQTADEFVRIAVALATDLPRLAQLRATLRQRMEQSPLMNGARLRGISKLHTGRRGERGVHQAAKELAGAMRAACKRAGEAWQLRGAGTILRSSNDVEAS